jgi:integrase
MVLALNTTMRSCEVKGLRWRDVNFMDRALIVRRASTKTDAGERVIPLNANGWIAIRELWDRAKESGGSEADHFIFPACENGNIEPTKPMKSWRSAWRKLTRVIECPACKRMQEPSDTCANPKCKADIRDIKNPLARLRFHDLRHQAITELAESQASDQTIMAIAGHVSRQMLEHYSRLEAKRSALDALVNRPKKQAQSDPSGYVTKNVTNESDRARSLARALRKLGYDVQITPIEPSVA